MTATHDPFRAYNFKLEINGVTEGHFTECSGLEIAVQVIDYRAAGEKQVIRKIPGLVDYGAVTLRYGLTESQDLWNWMQTVVGGKVERREASIVLLDAPGAAETMRWNMTNAWPSMWRGAPLDALAREVAIESLTLVFESLQRA